MATLTEDFTRMREELDQSHQDRFAFTKGLREEVPTLLAGFREHHAEMARQLRSGLSDFVADLRTVGEIFRGGHGTGHASQFSSTKPKRTKKAGKG